MWIFYQQNDYVLPMNFCYIQKFSFLFNSIVFPWLWQHVLHAHFTLGISSLVNKICAQFNICGVAAAGIFLLDFFIFHISGQKNILILKLYKFSFMNFQNK